jgi:hypothetical protein
MNHPSTDILTGLPAEELLRKGLSDLSAGAVTVASCLVRIIAPRLVRAGLVEAL